MILNIPTVRNHFRKKVNNQWITVEFKNGYVFNSISYPLDPNSTAEGEYTINQFTGDLESGTYRILTNVILIAVNHIYWLLNLP